MLEENLKKIRQTMGLSAVKFADKIEIPAMTLIKYERGERVPSAKLFVQLYKKLNVNMNWFVSGNGEMFNNSLSAADNDEFASKVDEILKRRGLI